MSRLFHRYQWLFFIAVISTLALTGCSNNPIPGTEAKYPTVDRDETTGGDNKIYNDRESVFGGDALHLFGGDKKKNDDASAGIGVNTFLWRASLDTVAFMPLASADPFGGTILTDWYSPPQAPTERYKLNVLILGRQLRSDGIVVKVFRQVQGKRGWQDAAVPAGMGTKIEDAILTRARQMRVAQMGNQ